MKSARVVFDNGVMKVTQEGYDLIRSHPEIKDNPRAQAHPWGATRVEIVSDSEMDELYARPAAPTGEKGDA